MKKTLTLLLSLAPFLVVCQSVLIVSSFEPVFFEENVDTVDTKWYPRLNSLGQFLEDNPQFTIQLHAYAHSTEKDFLNTVRNRAKNVLSYIETNFNVKLDENFLTNVDNRGLVPMPDLPYEKAGKRKVEFQIKKRK